MAMPVDLYSRRGVEKNTGTRDNEKTNTIFTLLTWERAEVKEG
jgi:hypothetical protein